MPAPPSTDETELDPAPGPPQQQRLHDAEGGAPSAPPEPADPDAPLSFVPHTPLEQTVRPEPVRIRTSRYGELEEHELLRLIDSIEDERARSRFRESIYISVFVWLAVAFVVFYGPKYLWHSPRVVLPSEVLRQREVTTLTAPSLGPPAPRVHTAPPAVDNHTLEHLRANEPKMAPPSPRPATPPPPTPRAETHPTPAAPAPEMRPATAPPDLPAAPAPQPATPARTPPPVVAEAPRPQPSSRPSFNTGSQSAGESIQNAVRNAIPGGGSPGGITNRGRGGSALGMGPAEILSDTQGVNFNPYLRRILQEIYDQWIPLIPEEARPPLSKSGVTMIRFTILPDGTIGAMHLDGSTHDDALNKAAWGSITGVGQFPQLPSQFHGPNLELRIHYLVNRQTE